MAAGALTTGAGAGAGTSSSLASQSSLTSTGGLGAGLASSSLLASHSSLTSSSLASSAAAGASTAGVSSTTGATGGSGVVAAADWGPLPARPGGGFFLAYETRGAGASSESCGWRPAMRTPCAPRRALRRISAAALSAFCLGVSSLPSRLSCSFLAWASMGSGQLSTRRRTATDLLALPLAGLLLGLGGLLFLESTFLGLDAPARCMSGLQSATRARGGLGAAHSVSSRILRSSSSAAAFCASTIARRAAIRAPPAPPFDGASAGVASLSFFAAAAAFFLAWGVDSKPRIRAQ